MKPVPSETDFIVVGAGIAGLRAAIDLAPGGRVLVLAKRELSESATQYAQQRQRRCMKFLFAGQTGSPQQKRK